LIEARATLNQWSYALSHFHRFVEEGLAEGYATGSVIQGLLFPFRAQYVSGRMVAAEAAGAVTVTGAAGYGGYRAIRRVFYGAAP
jgi:hypothetical protein